MTTRTPLYNHTSPDTAYLVADYPYGRKVRCRIRYWLESDPKRGFRFVSQTEHPTRLTWNAPKKSTYALLAAAMFLDDAGHVQWTSIHEYSDHAAVRDFIAAFPLADLTSLRPWCAQKAAFSLARAEGRAKWTINGEVREDSPAEIASNAADAAAWREIALSLPPRAA